MLLKDQILSDIKGIENPHLLHQVFEYIQVIKQTDANIKPNKKNILKYRGILSDAQASKLTSAVNKEFNQIEGEW